MTEDQANPPGQSELFQVYDWINDGLCILDSKLAVRFWNRVLEKWTGIHRQNIIGKNLFQMFPESQDSPTSKRLQDVFERGLPIVFSSRFHHHFIPVRLQTGNRQRLMIQDTYVRPVNLHGEMLAVVCIQDRTETVETINLLRKEREALIANQAKFDAISSATLDPIILIDSAGLTTFWNQAAEKMFGYTSEEALGKPVHDLLAPAQYGKKIDRGFEEFKRTGGGGVVSRCVEVTAQHKDKSQRPVELSISPLRINNEWHAVAIVRDISARSAPDADSTKSDQPA